MRINVSALFLGMCLTQVLTQAAFGRPSYAVAAAFGCLLFGSLLAAAVKRGRA